MIASYEADRIFVLILQKSSKWPFYPLFAPPAIAYCFFHQKYGH
ncbi:PTS fructose transporter subunit IIC, partial [Escherichia coli]